MTGSSGNRLYVALVHHPVIDKNGETIASAVTNLDLHDIARVCRTYGVKGYYVITPLKDQIVLANRILDHWMTGVGGTYNPKRRQALELVRVRATFDEMIGEIAEVEGCRPKTVVTTARRNTGSLSYCRLREMLVDPTPFVLAFGTAWGLSDAFMADADYILDPLAGVGTYNHLSVRSAVSIILDRLLGG
ncbi:MAG: RNA methyltransferase [Desulfosarcina sp.]|nr:RNA methyltransferase [Desulfosarcina sp.]MBC2743885.1 RNA methyltransferase [Desulfosarcina sp.]MBC2766794.1 RNA methyltransferase [Desulfosarcina sp.]